MQKLLSRNHLVNLEATRSFQIPKVTMRRLKHKFVIKKGKLT